MASMIVISCRRCDRRFQEVLDDPLQSQVNLNVANSFFRQHAVLSEMTASDSNHEYNPVHSRLSPTAQVASHILQKGYQAGSIVGSFAVLPASVALAWLYYKKPVSPSDMVRRVGISCVAGVGAIALLGPAKLFHIDQDGMVDRAYRLHYNESQRRTDLFAAAGSAVGLAAGGLLLRGSGGTTALHYLGAAGAGTAAGIVAHVLTRPAEQASPDKMMHELRNS